jgi:hypothetical protein
MMKEDKHTCHSIFSLFYLIVYRRVAYVQLYPERIVDQTFFWGTTTVSFNFTIITKPLWRSQTTDLTLWSKFQKKNVNSNSKLSIIPFPYGNIEESTRNHNEWFSPEFNLERTNLTITKVHPLLSVFIFQLNASQPNTNQTKFLS